MPVAQFPAGSPRWWLDRLNKRLEARRPELDRLDAYYRGDHPLLFASAKFRKAFGSRFDGWADNWCQLVADSPVERLRVAGFRYGQDQPGDTAAWEIWQRNLLDADSEIAHLEAMVAGESYLIVWADAEGRPRITVEHANQVITADDPGDRRNRLAALKKWKDDDGYLHATVYLPDALYRWRSFNRSSVGGGMERVQWVEADDDEGPVIVNPLGVVPVVPLRNRPRLLVPAKSEIADVVPLQDAVNNLIANMLVAAEHMAVKQRWATGMEIEHDDAGNPREPFEPGQALWVAEDPEVTFGEFSESDLGNFVRGVEMLVQHIASQSRTPPHYFFLRGEFPSGESIKSAETGLVAKVRHKQAHFGEAWEQAMRLAFLVAGDTARANVVDAETVWADPESRSESEHTDAVMKKASLGVPQEALWEELGYSPAQVQRFQRMVAQRAIADAAALAAFNTDTDDVAAEPAALPEVVAGA